MWAEARNKEAGEQYGGGGTVDMKAGEEQGKYGARKWRYDANDVPGNCWEEIIVSEFAILSEESDWEGWSEWEESKFYFFPFTVSGQWFSKMVGACSVNWGAVVLPLLLQWSSICLFPVSCFGMWCFTPSKRWFTWFSTWRFDNNQMKCKDCGQVNNLSQVLLRH